MPTPLIIGTRRIDEIAIRFGGNPEISMIQDALPLVSFGLPLESILSFALASFLIELTPGPNMTYLALVSASQGRRYGFATVLGVASGLLIIGIAAALGVTAIIQSSALLYEILRWSGVLFLLYLAYDGWHGETEDPSNDKQGIARLRASFERGLLTNLLNPKAAVFYVTVLPAFLPLHATLSQSVLLTVIFAAIATIIHLVIVVLAGALQPLLNNPVREQFARRFLSLLLAAVAIWFAIGTAR